MKTYEWRGFTIEKMGANIIIYGKGIRESYWYYSLSMAKKLFREKYIN